MKGLYDEARVFDIIYPTVPGWGGAGTIVASGGGFMGWMRQGKRVAFGRIVDKYKVPTGGCY